MKNPKATAASQVGLQESSGVEGKNICWGIDN